MRYNDCFAETVGRWETHLYSASTIDSANFIAVTANQARIVFLENLTMPVDPWFDEDGEMDIEEVQEDLSFAADLIGVGQRGKANRQRAETNSLLREQLKETNRIKSLPQCWHCGGRLELRGARLCPHCRTELKWEEIGLEKYTPKEAKEVKALAKALEAKRQAEEKELEKRLRELERDRKKRERFINKLKLAYGEKEVAMSDIGTTCQAVIIAFGMLISAGCLVSVTIALLLGFVGWSPEWWTQIHFVEIFGLVATPLAYFGVCMIFLWNSESNHFFITRLDLKGRSGAFDLFLSRVDLLIGWTQIACWLFIVLFTLLGFLGYAPEWWTTLSKGTYYGFLLGPMALSAIYIPITATIASYVRRKEDVMGPTPELDDYSPKTEGQPKKTDSNDAQTRDTKSQSNVESQVYFIRREKQKLVPKSASEIVEMAGAKKLKKGDEISLSVHGPWRELTKDDLLKMKKDQPIDPIN